MNNNINYNNLLLSKVKAEPIDDRDEQTTRNNNNVVEKTFTPIIKKIKNGGNCNAEKISYEYKMKVCNETYQLLQRKLKNMKNIMRFLSRNKEARKALSEGNDDYFFDNVVWADELAKNKQEEAAVAADDDQNKQKKRQKKKSRSSDDDDDSDSDNDRNKNQMMMMNNNNTKKKKLAGTRREEREDDSFQQPDSQQQRQQRRQELITEMIKHPFTLGNTRNMKITITNLQDVKRNKKGQIVRVSGYVCFQGRVDLIPHGIDDDDEDQEE